MNPVDYCHPINLDIADVAIHETDHVLGVVEQAAPVGAGGFG